jgi:hypothetical protein
MATETAKVSLIADYSMDRVSLTSWYYSDSNGFDPTESQYPATDTVVNLLRQFNPDDIFNAGDTLYQFGSSKLLDDSIGRKLNDYMYPYPSPKFSDHNGPYAEGHIDGSLVWPYNLYNYPTGYPNPLKSNEPGGNPDKDNRYWTTMGNHEYGQMMGYGNVGVTPYKYGGGSPKIIDGDYSGDNLPGANSTKLLNAIVDYAAPWLLDKTILSEDQQKRLNIGSADTTGNEGIYYSYSVGGTAEKPLIEVFNIDTARLAINSGSDGSKWNPDGALTYNSNSGKYEYAMERDSAPEFQMSYDPSDPDSPAYTGLSALDKKTPIPSSTDLFNGQKQFEWLNDSLNKSQATWKILTGHHAVYNAARNAENLPNGYMSQPYLQKMLKALNGSFDVWYNGHDHLYSRVLEQNDEGIGLGIPFITQGNSGANLSVQQQVPYGENIYEAYNPLKPSPDNDEYNPLNNNNFLQSDPVQVGLSGAATKDSQYDSGFVQPLYSYGSGATNITANSDYLKIEYTQGQVFDPSISNHIQGGIMPLTESFSATTSIDWTPNPGPNYNPDTDLAKFQVAITNGSISQVKVVKGGQGYMSTKGGNYTVKGFRIYGTDINSFQEPWAAAAEVDLIFEAGKLKSATLIDGGAGYESVATQFSGVPGTVDYPMAEYPKTDTGAYPMIVPLNYNLYESKLGMRLAADKVNYSDSYLIAKTNATVTGTQAQTDTNNGSIKININPADAAKDALANLTLTPGYSGTGQQAKYSVPQQGTATITDSLGAIVGTGTINKGETNINLTQLAAPGALKLNFSGDPLSSYLVNFKEGSSNLYLDYGIWDSGISVSTNTLQFTKDINLSVTRTDGNTGLMSFGLAPTTGRSPIAILTTGKAADNKALTTDSIFTYYGADSWLSSEGKAQGGSAASSLIAAGSYIPFAQKSDGTALAVQSVRSANNTVDVTFADGITARYSGFGTGTSTNLPGTGKLSVTVQRLGQNENGLAFYKADEITGAIQVGTQTLLPGQAGYLEGALKLATDAGLRLSASQLPGYGKSDTLTGLNLNAGTNYGVLILFQDRANDLSSSYAAANAGSAVQMQTFAAAERGVIYGIEDLRSTDIKYDGDFNDLIVTLNRTDFTASITA